MDIANEGEIGEEEDNVKDEDLEGDLSEIAEKIVDLSLGKT
jgi:hypothetical protein